MTGLIWFVQIVHYPLFSQVSNDNFIDYEIQHSDLTTYVVIIPMFVELITAIMLLIYKPEGIATWLLWLGAALVGVIWLSTAFLQVPAHSILSTGFNVDAHQQLVLSNWVRTVAWSARTVIVFWCLSKLLNPSS